MPEPSPLESPEHLMGPPRAAGSPGDATCTLCGAPLRRVFADLGMHPLCERIIPAHRALEMEPFYPLRVLVCEHCLLVQVPECASAAEIFDDEYPYFSSFSDSWVEHARIFVESSIDRLGLGEESLAVEIASNDGYLLQWFVKAGVPCFGVEPAANVAQAAEERGVSSVVRFFGQQTARDLVAEGHRADLLIGNNVLAHVPDINDFVAGLAILLAPRGAISLEFPHLLRLIEGTQFDTIYHEHFSYLSLGVVERILARHGLAVYDVEELPTHGGSLRVHAQHADTGPHPSTGRLAVLRASEHDFGLSRLETYTRFDERVQAVKHGLLEFLLAAKREGKGVVGYGAPGKGNTLLNYCGIKPDLLEYTVDRNPYKHGKFCPGSRIPILPVEAISETRPDYVLILPWNLTTEITRQMAFIHAWGGRFVVPIPEVTVLADVQPGEAS